MPRLQTHASPSISPHHATLVSRAPLPYGYILRSFLGSLAQGSWVNCFISSHILGTCPGTSLQCPLICFLLSCLVDIPRVVPQGTIPPTRCPSRLPLYCHPNTPESPSSLRTFPGLMRKHPFLRRSVRMDSGLLGPLTQMVSVCVLNPKIHLPQLLPGGSTSCASPEMTGYVYPVY